MAGDLAIRQGPWKVIFLRTASRELYNLADDLSEKHDVRAANPEVMTTLTVLFQRYIANGRSTPVENPEKRVRPFAGRERRRKEIETQSQTIAD